MQLRRKEESQSRSVNLPTLSLGAQMPFKIIYRTDFPGKQSYNIHGVQATDG